ncbi:MAG: FAD-dependent oxidoreductase [Thermodesulfobacteriota bacterium]|nr:FAD-dependent oxidoreductase [Thermodesulfobacteriota bacterium]
MRLIIIGADATGMSAASRAKRNMQDLEVIVFEKTEDVSYSACGMPYNIADPDRRIEELVVRKADVFREKQGIDLRTGHIVEMIEPDNKRVSGIDSKEYTFSLNYDRLLIATGAVPIRPLLPGFDLPGVMILKSLDDGRRIKEHLRKQKVKKAVIIGMGYIAMEMAESLKTRGIDVSMIKPRKRFIPWMNEKMAGLIKEELEFHGVEIYTGLDIERIEKNRDGLGVITKGTTFDAQMVLIATGVRPAYELAVRAGLELGPSNSISVNRCMQTSDPDIYAAGDCADAYHMVTGEKVWIPLALRANRSGWAAGDNMTGKESIVDGIVGTAVFKVFDLQVARTGLNIEQAKKAGFNPLERVIESSTRAHAHPGSSPIWVQMVADCKTGKLLGAQLLSKEGAVHRINAVAAALHAKMTVAQFSQIDFAYAPPFGPVWDPLLVAANQLIKKL